MCLPRKAVSALLVVLMLVCLMPALSGCHKDDESKDPNYYNGNDFKGHSTSSASTSGSTPATGQGRKGGE
jgi:hypothetical protein